MRRRVLVAMSGGVDSSVAAAMLRDEGHDVVGVAMRLINDDGRLAGSGKRCCSHEDFEDARRVAETLGFPFYVVNLRMEFSRRVIGNFVSEYLNGRTPNPCARCNSEIKFDRLWQRAQAIDAGFVATGHYARIVQGGDGFRLMRAIDEARDQSYFLFALGQKELSRTLFPLGEMTKGEVRSRARALGLPNADKPDSQEICFVPDGRYADFVTRHASKAELRPGRVVDPSGQMLGEHGGIHNFTVGQRRGLGIARGERLYVREIRTASNEVIVSGRVGLTTRGLMAGQVRLVNDDTASGRQLPIEVKIRYRHPALPATLQMIGPERAEVRFISAGPAVSPGQACVFYRGDDVLGGGFIERAL